MAPDGTGKPPLTDNDHVSDTHPSWSPDGSKLAYHREGARFQEVWSMNADGTGA